MRKTNNLFQIAYVNPMDESEIIEYRKELDKEKKREFRNKIVSFVINLFLLISIICFITEVAVPIGQSIWNSRNLDFPVERIEINEEGELIQVK